MPKTTTVILNRTIIDARLRDGKMAVGDLRVAGHCSWGTVWNMRNRRPVSVRIARRIGRALGIELAELVVEDPPSAAARRDGDPSGVVGLCPQVGVASVG